MESLFQARRVVRHHRHEIGASPERIFPLLCPVREYDWIDGWAAQLVYSQTGVAEQDCVFTTHRPDGPEAVWTVSVYDPTQHRIEFVVFHGRDAVERLAISLHAAGDVTTVRWTRTYTGLSPAGNRFIDAFTGEPLEAVMDYLGRALQHFLSTGTMLPRGESNTTGRRQ